VINGIKRPEVIRELRYLEEGFSDTEALSICNRVNIFKEVKQVKSGGLEKLPPAYSGAILPELSASCGLAVDKE